MAPGLTFIPLGTGDAFSARRYSACLLLEAAGARLLVDCPHPIRKILREGSQPGARPLDLDSIDAVVLTHLHSDHASGVESVGFFGRYVLGRRAVVAAHPEVAARLWEGLAPGMDRNDAGARMTLSDYLEVAPLDDARPVRIGPFEIACRRTRHPVPTFALRISAAGRSLGISADTPFDPSLVDWLSAADLVVHESGRGIHADYDRLAALPAPLRARMRLTHLADDFVAEGGAIEPLVQGRLYSV